MNRIFGVLCCVLLGAAFVSATQAQSNLEMSSFHESPVAQATEKIPVMDGEAGPCSLELIVIGADGRPVYAATVKVHIAYGFGGIRKLDLEAGTNSDGKVKFTGLPARVRRPPLEFQASKDEFRGMAAYDPSTECQAKHNITLEKSKAQEGRYRRSLVLQSSDPTVDDFEADEAPKRPRTGTSLVVRPIGKRSSLIVAVLRESAVRS